MMELYRNTKLTLDQNDPYSEMSRSIGILERQLDGANKLLGDYIDFVGILRSRNKKAYEDCLRWYAEKRGIDGVIKSKSHNDRLRKTR